MVSAVVINIDSVFSEGHNYTLINNSIVDKIAFLDFRYTAL